MSLTSMRLTGAGHSSIQVPSVSSFELHTLGHAQTAALTALIKDMWHSLMTHAQLSAFTLSGVDTQGQRTLHELAHKCPV